jgi:uncharacterized protein YcfJ
METWLQILLTVGGALAGAYAGVKVALAKLETQMTFVLEEIDRLRETQDRHSSDIASLKAQSFLRDHK